MLYQNVWIYVKIELKNNVSVQKTSAIKILEQSEIQTQNSQLGINCIFYIFKKKTGIFHGIKYFILKAKKKNLLVCF